MAELGETELVGIAHVEGEGPTDEDVSTFNNEPSGFPDHLEPSEWKRLRFVYRNFANLPHGVGDEVLSEAVECHGYNWRLQIYPGGYNKSSEGFVSIYLCCEGFASGQEVLAKHCIRVGAARETYLSFHSDSADTYDDNESEFGVFKAMKRKDVIKHYEDDEWKNFLDDHGSFIIDVDIQVGLPRSYKPANTIKADMLKVLDKAYEENSDVVFQVGDRTFHCLSGLLQVRAPELYSLVSEYDERTPIPILGVSPDTFQLLMLTVYGGEIPEDKKSLEVLKPLISAADRFGCTNSKLLAEQDLVSSNSISIENVAELLLFADGANCALIKEAATAYFLLNAKDVRKTEGYAKLRESPHVLEELLFKAAEANEKRPASPDLDERDPKRLCVSALRSELNDKGLDVDGSREMLVSRLEEANAAEAAAAETAAAAENADNNGAGGDEAIEVE